MTYTGGYTEQDIFIDIQRHLLTMDKLESTGLGFSMISQKLMKTNNIIIVLGTRVILLSSFVIYFFCICHSGGFPIVC